MRTTENTVVLPDEDNTTTATTESIGLHPKVWKTAVFDQKIACDKKTIRQLCRVSLNRRCQLVLAAICFGMRVHVAHAISTLTLSSG